MSIPCSALFLGEQKLTFVLLQSGPSSQQPTPSNLATVHTQVMDENLVKVIENTNTPFTAQTLSRYLRLGLQSRILDLACRAVVTYNKGISKTLLKKMSLLFCPLENQDKLCNAIAIATLS